MVYAQRIVVPVTLQMEILGEFHVGHLDISERKALMGSYVYWLKLDRETECLVKGCRGSALAAKLQMIKSEH